MAISDNVEYAPISSVDEDLDEISSKE